MSYLIEFHWVWLLIAWFLGLVVGWLTYQRVRQSWMDGLVWLVVLAVVIAAVIAITTMVVGRPGYLLEIAVLLVIAYFVGCPLGWALRNMAFVDAVSPNDAVLVPRPGYTFPGGVIGGVPAVSMEEPASAAAPTGTAPADATPAVALAPIGLASATRPEPTSADATATATHAAPPPTAATPMAEAPSASPASAPILSASAAMPSHEDAGAPVPHDSSTSPSGPAPPASGSMPSTPTVSDIPSAAAMDATAAALEETFPAPAATTASGPSGPTMSVAADKGVTPSMPTEPLAPVTEPGPPSALAMPVPAPAAPANVASSPAFAASTATPSARVAAPSPDVAPAEALKEDKPASPTAAPGPSSASPGPTPATAAQNLDGPAPPPAAFAEASLPAGMAPSANAMPPLPNEDRHPGTRPDGLMSARDGKADDLKRIKGIGLQNEGRLHGLGIWHFDQIAAWSPDNVKWVGSYLAFHGRIEREKWIDQAKALASGLETEFSKRVAAGKVATSSDDGSQGQKNVAAPVKPGPRKR